jgi:hypothetical protein
MPRKPGTPRTGGRKKGTPNKKTVALKEALRLNWNKAKREGGSLGVDYLRELALNAVQIVQATMPLREDGEIKRAGDPEECLKWSRLLKEVAAEIAQYESPRLSAVAVAPPQKSTRQTVTVRVFDSKGTQLDEYVDGERVPLSIGSERDRE